jgi:hypothetical protein
MLRRDSILRSVMALVVPEEGGQNNDFDDLLCIR